MSLLACLFAGSSAHAEPIGQQRYRTPIAGSEAYWHGFGSLSLGKGLRFNNPYRLATPLGDTPESPSWSAAYYDLGLGLVRGPESGFAHGAVVHLSIAAQGIPQEVLSVSYTALRRVGDGRTLLFGRAGIPLVLEPEPHPWPDHAHAGPPRDSQRSRAGCGGHSEGTTVRRSTNTFGLG